MKFKTFVLGLGAQKSGSTWLHSYLNHFSFSDFGPVKEYHIWDGVYSEYCHHQKIRFRELVKSKRDKPYLRFMMQNVP